MRRHEPLLGGALEPGRGLGQILRHAAAFGEAAIATSNSAAASPLAAAARRPLPMPAGRPVGRRLARAGAAGAEAWRACGCGSGVPDRTGGLRSALAAVGVRRRQPIPNPALRRNRDAGRQRDRLAIRRCGRDPRRLGRGGALVAGGLRGGRARRSVVAPDQDRVVTKMAGSRAASRQRRRRRPSACAIWPAELAGRRFVGLAGGGIGRVLVLGGGASTMAACAARRAAAMKFDLPPGSGMTGGRTFSSAASEAAMRSAGELPPRERRRRAPADDRAAGWGRSGAAPQRETGSAAAPEALWRGFAEHCRLRARRRARYQVRKRQGRLRRRRRHRGRCAGGDCSETGRRAAAGCRGCRPRWSPAGRPRGRACRARFRANPGCAGHRA